MSNVLLLKSGSAASASDTAIDAELVGLGHTVTQLVGSTASYTASLVGKNLVVIGSATPGQISTKLDAITIPVIGTIGTAPHTLFASVSASSPGTVSSFTVASTGDPVTTPDAANDSVVFATTSIPSLYVPVANLGAGAVAPIRYGSNGTNFPRACGAYYQPGGLLSDGTTAAPSFRGALQSLTNYAVNNTNGQRWFKQMVAMALASVNALPTANAGPDQTRAVGATATMAFSGSDPDGTITSYTARIVSKPAGSTAALSSTTTQNPTLTSNVPGPVVVGVIVGDSATPTGFSNEATMTVTFVASSINSGADAAYSVAPPPIPLVATLSGVGITGSWVQGITGTPNPQTVTIAAPTNSSTSFQVPSTLGTYRFHFDGPDETGTVIPGSVKTITIQTPVLGSAAEEVYDGAVWV